CFRQCTPLLRFWQPVSRLDCRPGRHGVTAFCGLMHASLAGWFSCHCVAAYAGLRLPPWMAEMPVLQEQKPVLSPDCEELILALLFCCLPSMAATLRAITL